SIGLPSFSLGGGSAYVFGFINPIPYTLNLVSSLYSGIGSVFTSGGIAAKTWAALSKWMAANPAIVASIFGFSSVGVMYLYYDGAVLTSALQQGPEDVEGNPTYFQTNNPLQLTKTGTYDQASNTITYKIHVSSPPCDS